MSELTQPVSPVLLAGLIRLWGMQGASCVAHLMKGVSCSTEYPRHCRLCFFVTFFSTFAAAPLIGTIRQDLNLTQKAVSGANVAAITGTIFARLILGTFTNRFGPRFAQVLDHSKLNSSTIIRRF